MSDKVFETAKWISIGILVGYFGRYALNWVKTWKANKDQAKTPENNQETSKQN